MSDMKLNLIMGARNGAKNERDPNDFYATDPTALNVLLDSNKIELSHKVLEPCAGLGHLSKRLKERGHEVISWDIIQRDFPLDWVGDFTTNENIPQDCDILTNPPFDLILPIATHALKHLGDSHRLILFLKIQSLEGIKRYEQLFKPFPPRKVLVHTSRQHTAMGGDFEHLTAKTQAYVWIIWKKGYKGITELDWI